MPRDLLKTLSYSLMHLTVAVTVAFVLTRDWRIALGVGLIEPLVQTVAYTLHERAWRRAGDQHPPIDVAPHFRQLGA
ncbi:DUF2061 domain-containing protein [Hyphomonas sp.]|uniref:DUF2061 domain-containing protein n=1 Tax=Hyphomonas sp. TaxID=87 RepID=UPI0032EC4A4C|tara:strand:+ start:151 stop:381 length:231 start_codon:yes stop_codon:yes gene_type:complete